MHWKELLLISLDGNKIVNNDAPNFVRWKFDETKEYCLNIYLLIVPSTQLIYVYCNVMKVNVYEI